MSRKKLHEWHPGEALPEFEDPAEEARYYRNVSFAAAMAGHGEPVEQVPGLAPEMGPRSQVIKFRATEDEKTRLRAAAERRGVSVAVVLRDFARGLPRPVRSGARRRRSA